MFFYVFLYLWRYHDCDLMPGYPGPQIGFWSLENIGGCWFGPPQRSFCHCVFMYVYNRILLSFVSVLVLPKATYASIWNVSTLLKGESLVSSRGSPVEGCSDPDRTCTYAKHELLLTLKATQSKQSLKALAGTCFWKCHDAAVSEKSWMSWQAAVSKHLSH